MLKLLIVDDEPLIQVGIQSMLPWPMHQIEICSTARNGQEALGMIEKHHPQLVIADIKMPIMDGLTLAKTCKEQYGALPLFIILTSHEDFKLVKQAMHYDVVEYLIKLELTPEVLLSAIQKAQKIIDEKKQTLPSNYSQSLPAFYDQFFISLLHNLFENPIQFAEMTDYLHLDFSAYSYVVAQCSLSSPLQETHTSGHLQLTSLYTSTLKMLEELLPQYIPCYLFSLNSNDFCIIFCLSEEATSHYTQLITDSLNATFSMVHKYFNVQIKASCGHPVTQPLSLSESYQEAKQMHPYLSDDKPLIFFETFSPAGTRSLGTTFNISLFKADIQKAFEESNCELLKETLTAITDLFKEYPQKYLQALDAACNILYFSLSLLPHAEETISSFFTDYEDGYRSIYKQASMPEVLHWLEHLKDGLCDHLSAVQKTQTNKIVSQVKAYIDSHLDEKLLLPEVASVFHITPNYLSILFKRYLGIGFSEYITKQKINYAKTLLNEGQLKIYEIADQLGFESAFYFSKVFKKVEGCSPRDYKQYI